MDDDFVEEYDYDLDEEDYLENIECAPRCLFCTDLCDTADQIFDH